MLRRTRFETGADCANVVFSPSGDRYAYSRAGNDDDDSGVYVASLAGAGAAQRLMKKKTRSETLVPLAWLRGGTTLLVLRWDGNKIWIYSIPVDQPTESTAELRPLFPPDSRTGTIVPSPDGDLWAYGSSEFNRLVLYVCRFADGKPGLGVRVATVTTRRGWGWAPDGRTLYYLDGDRIMAAAIRAAPTSMPASQPVSTTVPPMIDGEPTLVLDLSEHRALPGFAVLPDGRFLITQKGANEDDVSHFNVVLNWVEELRRRVPSPGN